MSKETMEWLNNNVMFGFTATRSTWGPGTSFGNGQKPWFASEDYEHSYEGAIPVEDVVDELFYWEGTEAQLTMRRPVADIEVADGIGADGLPFKYIDVEDSKAIIRPDTGDVLGIFKNTYQIHQYEKWLIDNVATMVDGELGISSAGLLRNGGQAWVSLELPDDVEVEGAGHIRPCIIAATSMDGTLATTYATRVMRPECDNSLHWSLAAEGGTFKVRHTSKSLYRIGEAREALGIIYAMTEQAESWFNELADVDVTGAQWQSLVNRLVPDVDPIVKDGKVQNQRALNTVERKRDELHEMYRDDPRAAPWSDTLAGAYHAVNTWNEHVVTQDDNIVRRQMTGTLNGNFDRKDAEFWSIVKDLDIVVPELVAVR